MTWREVGPQRSKKSLAPKAGAPWEQFLKNSKYQRIRYIVPFFRRIQQGALGYQAARQKSEIIQKKGAAEDFFQLKNL